MPVIKLPHIENFSQVFSHPIPSLQGFKVIMSDHLARTQTTLRAQSRAKDERKIESDFNEEKE